MERQYIRAAENFGITGLRMLQHVVFPGAMAQVLAVVNQVLPQAGGAGTERVKGRDSKSSWSPSWLTSLSEEAAVRNNEVIH